MAEQKKKARRGQSEQKEEPKQKTPPAKPENKNESNQFWSVILFASGLLALLLILVEGSAAWRGIHNILFGMFGIAAAFIPLILIYTAILISMERTQRMVAGRAVWGVALTFLSSAIVQIFFYGDFGRNGFVDTIRELYVNGKTLDGGGVFSAIIAWPLIRLFDVTGAKIIVLLLLFVFFMLLTNLSVLDLFRLICKPFRALAALMHEQWDESRLLDEYEQEQEEESRHADREAVAIGNAEQPRRTRASRNRSFDVDIPIIDGTEKLPPDVQEDTVSPAWEKERPKKRRRNADGKLLIDEEPPFDTEPDSVPLDDLIAAATTAPTAPTKKISDKEQTAQATAEIAAEVQQQEENAQPIAEYHLPSIDLLTPGVSRANDPNAADELRQNAAILVDTLKSFGVQVRITGINRGPTVTRYEVQPSAGVKISRITGLADDIALNLAAGGVRIEAPIPGKPAVGIEVANANKDMVSLREILESEAFAASKSMLSFAVGKDIDGNIILGDIAKMPHMIIAGATGSGKSVCTNSIIMSILYHAKPSEVKLVLIDPKIVEFKIYDGIPHLLIPVVTDPRKAAGALNWATQEMDRRYQLCAQYNVRDLKDFNALAEKRDDIDPMPQIVIVIDEFADLMMTSSKEVEDAVCRIAQKARAAGMHLIIATQRPTTDVITGLIKSNVPSRIALSVKSQMDSRIILDTGGAEKLLGHGDMLYSPNDVPKPIRVQGCFCPTEDVERVVEYIKSEAKAEYSNEIIDAVEQSIPVPKGEKQDEDSFDHGSDEDLIERAIDVVVEMGQASTSSLQRKLKLGYARAARIMDQLEELGVIGPYEGAKPRRVLLTQLQADERKLRIRESKTKD